jgi:3-hydroxyacyl-[acyl-carrier-protein] dehydratase
MSQEANKLINLDARAIQTYQQNRYPLLFIDFVSVLIPGESAIGFKNFSYNEWYFPAHFEDEPVVPGFVLIESLTQMFLMTFLSLPGNAGRKTGFVSIKDGHFKRKVVPGDRLDIVSTLHSYSRGLAKGVSVGHVAGMLACSAELVIVVPDVFSEYLPK